MKHSDTFFAHHLALIKRRYPVHQRVACNPFDGVPFIDVVLLILLFLIINSGYVVQPGVHLKLPQANQTQGVPYNSLLLTISRENTIFFDDELTNLEELPEAFNRMIFEKSDHYLIIEADEGVDHQVLISLYDMAFEAGIRDVILATDITKAPVGEGAP